MTSINCNQLQEYDDSVRSYVVGMGLKSLTDVENMEQEVDNDNKMMDNMNNNSVMGVDSYAKLTSNLILIG